MTVKIQADMLELSGSVGHAMSVTREPDTDGEIQIQLEVDGGGPWLVRFNVFLGLDERKALVGWLRAIDE